MVSFLALHGPGFPQDVIEKGDKCIFSELGAEHLEVAKLLAVAMSRGIILDGYVHITLCAARVPSRGFEPFRHIKRTLYTVLVQSLTFMFSGVRGLGLAS